MRRSTIILALPLLATVLCAFAIVTAAAPTTAPTTQAAATTAPSMMTINASDKSGIQAAMPTVMVVGVIDNVTVADSVITLNFKDTADSQFYAVILSSGRDSVLAAYNNDIAKAITGKTVRVTGNVVLYRGRPEIIINAPDQLAIVK
jgi:DNA/RNA endonuclease YhcR with UshA esterase domain